MKRFFALILFSLILITSVVSVGATSVEIIDGLPSVYDGGDLLFDSEEDDLAYELDYLRSVYGYDIVVVTVDTLGDLSSQEYADDFYDYNCYGDDGILLLVCMEYRDWAISTKGECIDIFNDDAQEYMSGNFTSYMSDGDFASAFTVFAEDCDYIIQNYDMGNYYGVNYGEEQQEGFYFSFSMVFTAIIAGVIIAFIAVLVMKGQLNTVKFQSAAADYLRKDRFSVNVSRDIFLYSTVSRVAKPKDTGRSSVHTSSSGSSHGGSSGKF